MRKTLVFVALLATTATFAGCTKKVAEEAATTDTTAVTAPAESTAVDTTVKTADSAAQGTMRQPQ